MSNAQMHQEDGYQWSIDGDGTLTIEKTEGGDGTIHLAPIWEEYQRFDPLTDGSESARGIVGYRQPWFEHRNEIIHVRVGDGITEIPNGGFESLRNLQTVVLPAGLKSIGVRAFIGCKSLHRVQLPDSLEIIWDSAFYGCDSLADVALPDGLRNIGKEAFASCDNLKSLSVPAGVKLIGDGALEHRVLQDLTLPIAFKENKKIFHHIFPSHPQPNPRLRIRYVKPPKSPKSDTGGDKPAQSLFARLFKKG